MCCSESMQLPDPVTYNRDAGIPESLIFEFYCNIFKGRHGALLFTVVFSKAQHQACLLVDDTYVLNR